MLTAFSDLHDWSKPYMFGAVPECFAGHLGKIVDQKGGKVQKHPCADVYLPMEDSLKLSICKVDLEDDFEVDRLTIENATKVNTHWRYGSIVDHKRIAEAIKTLKSAGVFKRTKHPKTGEISSSRTNEDLVSWIVFRQIGTLNALYTVDDYRRRGLARWALEAASKWLAEAGFIPVCDIEEYNEDSRKLVDKIGFKLIQTVFWMTYEPSNGHALQE
ncbi:unnamed protein product [Orchesella dallaii]|uniref:N-acetyltransferase domain-containing protein n=1 Tax=Orchesella dallaii TaxID=48710 RepID=A0ABP1QLH6_9HEXA